MLYAVFLCVSFPINSQANICTMIGWPLRSEQECISEMGKYRDRGFENPVVYSHGEVATNTLECRSRAPAWRPID